MLSSGLSYNLFFWIEFAIGCLLFLAVFFLFEETMYFRQSTTVDNMEIDKASVTVKHEEDVQHLGGHNEVAGRGREPPRRKTYWQQVKVFDRTDPKSPIFVMMVSSNLIMILSAWYLY